MIVAIAVIGLILAVTLLRGWNKDIARAAPEPSRDGVTSAPARVETRPRPAELIRGASTVDPGDFQERMDAAQAQAQRKAQNQHLALAARFAAEKVDPRWAAAQQADILSASKAGQIAQLQAQPKQIDVDCKSSTCRVAADFTRRSVAEDWLTLFLMNMGTGMGNASYEYSTNPDGSARLTVYGVSASPR